MLSSSPSTSPTFSARSSPNASFHARSYQASCRASSHSRSPRLRPSVSSASRRLDAPSASPRPQVAPAAAAATPIRTPLLRKAQTADAATQYTPPDLPPTASQASTSTTTSAAPTTIPTHPSNTAQGTRAQAKRRISAAEPATEPPEPDLRVDPQPVEQNGQQSSGEEEEDDDERHTERASTPTSYTTSSSPKRARPPTPTDKVLPLKYETCAPKDLGAVIANMLMEVIRHNDPIPLADGQLTRWHSRAPPGISVHDYLTRLIVHATLPPAVLLSMVYYIDRLCALYPIFMINSLTVHRFLISAATVAAKGLSDSFWTNSTYARVGGVSVKELALLELELLQKLDWRIVPKPEVLVDYYVSLVERCEGYTIER